MRRRTLISGSMAPLLLSAVKATQAASPRDPVVRIAELKIAPKHLEDYIREVRKEMEISVKVEPGVLAIYSVAEKSDRTSLRFFEIYADEAAYASHIASPHFREYVENTKHMITARKLIETVPVQLSSRRP